MPRPDTSPGSHGPGPRPLWLLGTLAAVTVVLGLLVALAPVVAQQPVVSWPQDGRPASSTVLPLSPYRPLQFDATVPCSTLRALDDRPQGGDALRTRSTERGRPDEQGLTVSAADGRVTITLSGTELLDTALPDDQVPDDRCGYRVTADADGARVERDGRLVAQRRGVLPPQVAELATEAEPAAAAGLAVELRPDDRYASHPSVTKLALLAAHGLALLATLLLAWRLWRGSGPGLARPRPSAVDAVVVLVSVAWLVLGPLNWDDAWYALMARNAGEAGYIGNYVYMFNTTENPFVASQYLLQAWGTLGGWGLPWLRVLPLLYGLLTYALLRLLLHSVGGDASRRSPRGWVWALAAGHLLWWLPYGMMLRPEPLIALCTAGVLLLAEVARRRRSLGALALATAVVALALTVAPTGIVAAAPLVITVPWLLALLRERGWGVRITAVLVAAAAGTVAVPVGFADASLGEVLDATATHRWYYLTMSWYEEFFHFNSLLGINDTGVWGRRAPVILTLAVLAVVAIGSGRWSGPVDPLRRLLLSSAITTAVAFALLSLTPTKWVNHFGAVGSAGAVLLAAAMLRSPLPRRSGATVATIAVLVVAMASAVAYAGPNLWRPYSDWGQPFGDHLLPEGTPYELGLLAPHYGSIYLRNPLVWLVLAGVIAAGLAWWRRREGRREGNGRSTLTVETGLLRSVSAFSVVLLVAVFSYAPVQQYPGWTVALSNLRAVAGQPCGLATGVEVLAPSGAQPRPSGAPQLGGDFALAGATPRPVQPPAAGTPMWHDSVPPARRDVAGEQGSLVTPWFTLPDSAATHLSVPVAAGTVAGQQVRVQFGTGDPADPRPARIVELDLVRAAGPSTWHELALELDGSRATAVRILADDEVTGSGSWLAVAAPSLTSWQPAATVTRGPPAFADQLSAVLWPCADQVAISDGIVAPPRVRMLTGDGIPGFVLHNSHDPRWGGTFVQVESTATYVQPETRIHPSGPPTRAWGLVQRVVYDHPVGRVDIETRTATESGWDREMPLTGEQYSGRKFIG